MKTYYFKKCKNSYTSIVDALKSVGVLEPSLTYRKKIAKINNINYYTGTKTENLKLLSLLKKGKLIKKIVKTNSDYFIEYMQNIHLNIKKYGHNFYYSSAKAEDNFEIAIKKAKEGRKTGLTCVVPTRWGMRYFNINPSNFYSKNGKFTKYDKDMQKYLLKITEGDAIGKTIKQAVNAKLLKPGDIICFKNKTHTVSYTGSEYNVYDGGTAAELLGYSKVGIILDYSKVSPWKDKVINGILRWR